MRKTLIITLLLGTSALCLPAQPEDLFLRVETIAIHGAIKTRHQIILNELAFVKGDSLKETDVEALIERSRNNVFNLGLFTSVQVAPYVVEQSLTIVISVQERWYFLGTPYLQVEERNSYDLVYAITNLDFRRLVYGASIQWRNITGRNETLTLFGQLGFSQQIMLDIVRPTLSRKSLDHRFGLAYRNQHELIIGTEDGKAQWRRTASTPLTRQWKAYIGAKRRIGLYKTLYVELKYEHFRFSDSLYAFSLEGGPARTLTTLDGLEYFPSIQIQFFKDKRDYRGFPLSGWKYQILGRITGGPAFLATTGFGKIGGTWAHHLPVGRRFNFAYGTQHLLTVGSRLPFFSKSFLGISQSEFSGVSTTLRGYEAFAAGTTYMGVIKSEWKYALVPRQFLHFEQIPYPRFKDLQIGLYLSAFCDIAYLRDDSFNGADQSLTNQLLTGYGIGLNVIGFYDMLLRVEYARNHFNQGGIYLHTDLQIK